MFVHKPPLPASCHTSNVIDIFDTPQILHATHPSMQLAGMVHWLSRDKDLHRPVGAEPVAAEGAD